MQNTISVLLARYPGNCVTIPFRDEEPIQVLLDRVSERLCTTLETGRLYIDGIEVWDYEQTVQHYQQLGHLFVYSNPHTFSSTAKTHTNVSFKDGGNTTLPLTLFVYSPKGKSFIVRMSPTNTILELKSAIRARQGIPEEIQSLIHSCNCLADTRTIGYYGIRNNATIDLSVRLRGGYLGATGGGLSLFADVSDQDAICSGMFSPRAPPGRRAGVGTNVEITCKCSPNHRVVSNQGCGIYELGVTQVQCPLCNSTNSTPVTAIFWACEYRTRGVKLNGDKHVSEWRRVGDGEQFEFFNPKKRSTWTSLLIETRLLGHPDVCPLCLKLTSTAAATAAASTATAATAATAAAMTTAAAVAAGAAVATAINELIACGHLFHDVCISRWGNK